MRLYNIVKNYFKNLKVFHKLLIKYQSYDAGYGWLALRLVLEDVREYMKNDHPFPKLGTEKNIKDMTIAIELLKRIKDNRYGLDNFDYEMRVVKDLGHTRQVTVDVIKLKDLPSIKGKNKVEQSQKQNDLQLLVKLLTKRMKNWWE